MNTPPLAAGRFQQPYKPRYTIDNAQMDIESQQTQITALKNEIASLTDYRLSFEVENESLRHRIRLLEKLVLSVSYLDEIIQQMPHIKARFEKQQPGETQNG